MAKKIKAIVTLQLPAGKATPAPPVGPVLGQHGINLVGFVKEYNDKSAPQAGQIVPVQVTIYEDRSFTILLKTPPTAALLRQYAKVEKGSGKPNKEKVGKVTAAQVREIADIKMKDLNAVEIDDAIKQVEGTARSMGITIQA